MQDSKGQEEWHRKFGCIATSETVKPPLGIKPRWLIDEDRLLDIDSGIVRSLVAGWAIATKWIEERNEIIERIGNR